jgi:hypothetical protein
VVFGEKWEAGTGTIVFAENKNASKRHQSGTYRDTITSNWAYVIEVSPPGQEAFRDKISDYYHSTQLIGFHVGQTFQVLFDAKRQKVKWDGADPTIAALLPHKQANTSGSVNDRLEAALNGETPPPAPAPATFDARRLTPEQRQQAVAANKLMRTDPEAGRAAMTALGLTPLGGGATPVVTAPTTAPSTNITDELAKLADLKTQGVLTDEEFAAAKQKLLGV